MENNFYYAHITDIKVLADAAGDDVSVAMAKLRFLAKADVSVNPGDPDYYPGTESLDLAKIKEDFMTMDLSNETFLEDVKEHTLNGVIERLGL